MKKKMLSALLAVIMILTLLPISALSSEIPVNYPDIEIEEEGFSYPENPITYSDSEDGISASLPHYQASTEEPTGRFARRQLYSLDYADELLELYDGFVAAAETFSTTFVISLEAAVAVSNTNKDEDEHKRVFKTAMLAYANDYPEHFWVDLSHGVKLSTVLIDEFTAEYRVTFKNLEDVSNQTVRDQFEQACLDIIEEVGITVSTSDYDKALLLHDYLVQNVAYTSGRDHSHDAYGAVIEGKGVCEAYTEAYQYLLSLVGVTATRVVGVSHGEGHAWTMVTLGGENYYVDVTWDDPENAKINYYPYLSNYLTFHSYFAITTETLDLDHDISMPYDPPTCTATEYNYFNRPENASKNVNSTTLYAEVLRQLTEPGNLSYAAVRLTSSMDVKTWFNNNYSALASAIGLKSYTRAYNYMQGELHILLAPHKVLYWNQGLGYEVYDANGNLADEYHLVANDPIYFKVEIASGFYKTNEFAVKISTTPVTPDKNGVYSTGSLNGGTVLVDGVAAQLDIGSTASYSPIAGGYSGSKTAGNLSAKVGDILTYSASSIIAYNDPDVTWKWVSVDPDSPDVETVVSNTYVYKVKDSDIGNSLSLVAVSTANGKYFGNAYSEPIRVEQIDIGTNASYKPVIEGGTAPEGKAYPGDTLSVSATSLLYGDTEITWQWYRDSSVITGAVTASYTVVASDAEHSISVKAIPQANGKYTGQPVSASVAVINTEITPELTPIAESGVTASDVPSLGRAVLSEQNEVTVAAFAALFSDSSAIEITKPDGSPATASAMVGTGFKIKLKNGENVLDEATIVVYGDTNGDGSISSSDALLALRASAGLSTLDAACTTAAKVAGKASLSSSDALRILRFSVSLETSILAK